MPVGLLTLDFQFHDVHSLKEKRAILQKLLSRLRARFNVAVAELDHQDAWQRATVAVVTVASSQHVIEASLRQMLEESERIVGLDAANYSLDYFE